MPPAAPLARFQHSATVLANGLVLVAGGYHTLSPGSTGRPLPPMTSVQILDPSSGLWWNAAPMHTPRARHAAVALPDGKVLVAGGFGMTPLSSVEIYDPDRNVWLIGGSLSLARMDHALAVVSDKVVATGGIHASPISSFELLSPSVASVPWDAGE
jgi:hypothetical protein